MSAREQTHSPRPFAPADTGGEDPAGHAPIGLAPIADELTPSDYARWLHRLRNEINTAHMACAAAQVLLDNGAVELARENLRRAANACSRSAKVLDEAPTRG